MPRVGGSRIRPRRSEKGAVVLMEVQPRTQAGLECGALTPLWIVFWMAGTEDDVYPLRSEPKKTSKAVSGHRTPNFRDAKTPVTHASGSPGKFERMGATALL